MSEKRKREKKQRSLSAKTIHYAVLSCIIFGLIAEMIGVAIYGTVLSKEYVTRAFYTASNVSNSVKHGTDSAGFTDSIMKVYNSLDEDQLSKTGTPEYREYYSDVDMSEGGAYDMLMHLLGSYINSGDISDVYVGMYDNKRNALVYVVDPEETNRFYPGEWEYVQAKEANKFLNWNGSGMLYDFSYTQRYGWLCTTGVPLQDNQGNTWGFVLADVGVGNIIRSMNEFVLKLTIAFLLLTLIVAYLMTKYMKKSVVEPINSIAEAAVGYIEDKQNGHTSTDRFSKLDINTHDELENLSRTMAEMEKNLSAHEENIMKISAEKERIGTELHMATQIQQSMLPNIFPPYPDRDEFDIYATMDPAKEVGGDFFDFFLIDKDHLCMIMADVSGKGVPAALFMMASKIVLQSHAMMGKSPSEILNETNRAICSNNKMDMFVTVWLGIFEISTGKLIASNAGHEYPVLKKSDGDFEIVRDTHGLVLGGMEGVKYKEYELMLEPGEKLFLYTDGVTEAADSSSEMFGIERMIEALNAVSDESPEQILKNVRAAVDGFVKGAEQFDDITMLCFEYKKKKI